MLFVFQSYSQTTVPLLSIKNKQVDLILRVFISKGYCITYNLHKQIVFFALANLFLVSALVNLVNYRCFSQTWTWDGWGKDTKSGIPWGHYSHSGQGLSVTAPCTPGCSFERRRKEQDLRRSNSDHYIGILTQLSDVGLESQQDKAVLGFHEARQLLLPTPWKAPLTIPVEGLRPPQRLQIPAPWGTSHSVGSKRPVSRSVEASVCQKHKPMSNGK